MTDFLSFADLTWPEVAALPRDLPLVIPLGEGYDLARLAEALGRPSQIGLLPALPYGWRNSGLEVPAPLLGSLLANLLDSLRDDGFTRVYALTPQGLDLGLGAARIVFAPRHRAGAPGARRASRRRRTGQGGAHPHWPHGAARAAPAALHGHADHRSHRPRHGRSLRQPWQPACPPSPYGASTHRASFAGTLNCGGRAFEDFWLAVVEALVARGFDRFYLISGHGGNCSYLVNVVKSAGERQRRIFCATTWLHTSGHIAAPVVQATRRSARGGMGHAGELETAMILALRPDLVHMDRVVDEIDFISTESYFMDWVEGGDLVANPPWDDDTRTGAYGAGSVATVENGQLVAGNGRDREKVAHVQEIHEQHRSPRGTPPMPVSACGAVNS